MRWLRTLSFKARIHFNIIRCTSVQSGGRVSFYEVAIEDFVCLHECEIAKGPSKNVNIFTIVQTVRYRGGGNTRCTLLIYIKC